MLSFKEFCEQQELAENAISREDIEHVLDIMGITNYKINSDMTVDINKDKSKEDKFNFIQMPFKVGNIVGTVWRYIEDMNKFKGYKNER
ncbi:MAG: hypothetical protein PHF21_05315 [Bacilli bacterium]|nr:hypothetical protein [Bacilli bacterium]